MALPPMKPTGNAAPEAAMEGAPRDDSKYLEDGEPNVSPEEQAEYEQFMNNGLSLIYVDGEDGAQVQPAILEALRVGGQADPNGPNPAIMALANTAVEIVSKLDDSSREAGTPTSDDVLMHGGLAIVEELAEVSEAANIYDYSEEEMTGAYQQAVDMYRDKAIADGRTSKETLEGQFAEINDAEAAGKLGDVLPGLGGGTTVGEPPVQAKG